VADFPGVVDLVVALDRAERQIEGWLLLLLDLATVLEEFRVGTRIDNGVSHYDCSSAAGCSSKLCTT